MLHIVILTGQSDQSLGFRCSLAGVSSTSTSPDYFATGTPESFFLTLLWRSKVPGKYVKQFSLCSHSGLTSAQSDMLQTSKCVFSIVWTFTFGIKLGGWQPPLLFGPKLKNCWKNAISWNGTFRVRFQLVHMHSILMWIRNFHPMPLNCDVQYVPE